MRSPARLVTGTAAAALTAAALGLAIPSAHADGLGGPERTAATAAPDPADCGSVDTTAAVPCDSGGVAADDPGGVEDGLDPLADPGAGEPEELDGPDPADELYDAGRSGSGVGAFLAADRGGRHGNRG